MKNIFLTIFVIAIISVGCNSGTGRVDGSNSREVEVEKSPEQLREELRIHERNSPSEYLFADGTYKENFWGDKLKIKCTIRNNATLVSFKDMVVRVTFYTKTDTELGSKDYTLYEIVDANSEKIIDMKIDTYRDVEKIGWRVISAIPVN